MSKYKATVITNSKDRGEDYWKKQKKQIAFLKEVYIDVYSSTEDQVTIFKTEKADYFWKWFYDKTYAVTKISVESFDTDEWLNQVNQGDGILKVTMRKIIQHVCEYQINRKKRPIYSSGFVNDPTNLLCHELKTWCVQTSRGGEETIDSICSENGELSKRIQFLETIINEPNEVFKQGDNSKITFLQTLQFSTNQLKKLSENLNLYINNRSAREDFKHVVSTSNDLLQFGVDFLDFSIHHKENISLISDIDDLRHPKLEPLLSRMDCETGKMMQCLLNSPAFLSVFEDKANGVDEAKFEESPASMIRALKPDDSSEEKNALINFLMHSSSAKSGIFNLLNKKQVVSEYIELHLLLNELAKFVYAANLLFNLSGEGGNLFVYGLINKPVEEILGCFIQCLEKSKTAFNHFMQLLDSCKEQFIDDKRYKDSAWGRDYERVISNHKRFKQTTSMCINHLAKIRDKACESSVEKIEQKIEDNLLKLFTLCKTLCKDWGDIDISERFIHRSAPSVKALNPAVDEIEIDELEAPKEVLERQNLPHTDSIVDEDISDDISSDEMDEHNTIEGLIDIYPKLADYSLFDLLIKFRKYSKYDGNSTLVEKYITIACNYLNTGSSFEEAVKENRLKILRAGCACVKYFHHNDYDESLLVQHIKATSEAIFLKKNNPDAKGLYVEFKRSTFFGRAIRNGSQLEMDYMALQAYIDQVMVKKVKQKQRVLLKKFKALQTDLQLIVTDLAVKNVKLNGELERLRGEVNSSTRPENLRDYDQLSNLLRRLCATLAKKEEELESLKDIGVTQSSHINELSETLVDKIAKIEYYKAFIDKLFEEMEIMRDRINDPEGGRGMMMQ